jgi:hypothetical protein
MGGSGSGAPRRRRIAEETWRIDVRRWRRLGYLKRPAAFSWQWSQGGEVTSSITVMTSQEAITLAYTVDPEGDARDVRERIVLDRIDCRFGGAREYFRCPRCWRRGEVLYWAAGRFICRKCARIGYAIENLEKQWRADRRYRQLESRLNEDGSKPSRMRWATFDRICAQLEAYDAASWAGIERVVARLIARHPE